MCILGFIWNNLISLMPPSQTITKEVPHQRLNRLNTTLTENPHAYLNRNCIILLHDNARLHAAKDIQDNAIRFMFCHQQVCHIQEIYLKYLFSKY